jgi:nucleoside-diphosphate-sugar epimerase
MPPGAVLAQFVRNALIGQKVQWFGSGTRAQNFVHVFDVVRAALLASSTSCPGVYNVGGSEAITMRDLAHLVVELTPGTRSTATAAGLPDVEDGWRWDVDLSRAAAGLGYRPTLSLAQGLSEYIAWERTKADRPGWWVQ